MEQGVEQRIIADFNLIHAEHAAKKWLPSFPRGRLRGARQDYAAIFRGPLKHRVIRRNRSI